MACTRLEPPGAAGGRRRTLRRSRPTLPADRGDATIQAAAKRDAAAELEALTPQIPLLVIQVAGAPASELALSLDGRELSSAVVGEQQPVDPGKHHVEVRRGERVVSADVQVGRGETKVASLSFDQPVDSTAVSPANAAATPGAPGAAGSASASVERGSSLATLGHVLVGAGVAGIAAGGLFGYLAIQAKGEQTQKCAGAGNCVDHSGAAAAHETAVTRGTVSTIAFIGGAVATTVGIVVLTTSRKRTARDGALAKVALSTSVSPAAACVRLIGEF